MKARIKISDWGKRALKWIPNSLTLCNSICGFVAILYTLHAYEYKLNFALLGDESGFKVFTVVAILIFSAMVFDAMDGLAARALNAASMHGIQMDSLSDMVTFGVAPAVMVTVLTNYMGNWQISTAMAASAYICGSIYLGGAALRLATYNVYAINGTKKNPNWFSGMPSPGAAAALCVLVFIMPMFSGFFKAHLWIIPAYAAILGLLMVSPIPYIHAGRFLMSVRRNRKKLTALVVLLAVVIIFRFAGLAAIVTGYVLSGPVIWLYNKLSGKEIV